MKIELNICKVDILTSENVEIDLYEDKYTSIFVVKIIGKLSVGSSASKDCAFIKQRLAIFLNTYNIGSLILELTELEYTSGNGIIDAFALINKEIDYCCVLSNKNKFGLSSLWCFNIKNPKEGIYYTIEEAFKYLEMKLK